MEQKESNTTIVLAIIATVAIAVALIVSMNKKESQHKKEAGFERVVQKPTNTKLVKADNIKQKAINGSTISEGIKHNSYAYQCAHLLTKNTPDITVGKVSRQSILKNNYLILYRFNNQSYSKNMYNTSKCKINNGTIRILSIFENF